MSCDVDGGGGIDDVDGNVVVGGGDGVFGGVGGAGVVGGGGGASYANIVLTMLYQTSTKHQTKYLTVHTRAYSHPHLT